MPPPIPFKFGLSPDQPLLSEQDGLWSAPLPMTRQAFNPAPGAGDTSASISYGDYFTAARDFLTQGDFKWLRHAATVITARTAASSDIRQVGVYLLKHGAFYHPAYVVLSVFDRHEALALNVAVSSEGREVLPREFDCLIRLNEELPTVFWPDVFGRGEGRIPDGRRLPMFVGQWFPGCYEFHLTRQTPGRETGVVVWDTDTGHRMLTGAPVLDLIRQAAAILSFAYHPLTFEAVLDWHHAAGDFVVQTTETGLALHLITVRNYGPLIRNPEPDMEAVLDGLLLFLVNITLRLRLDRLDGVGDLAAYPDMVVPAICDGFWDGLKMSVECRGLPEELISATEAYFGLHQVEQLTPLAQAVVANYPPLSDEGRLLRALVDDHVGLLARAIGPSGMV